MSILSTIHAARKRKRARLAAEYQRSRAAHPAGKRRLSEPNLKVLPSVDWASLPDVMPERVR